MIDIRHCDNLKLMAELTDEYVDLIYSDILYGTGRNFGEFRDLPAKRNEIESHYMPRLVEMHRVLSNTGQIYLQMDYRIVHWIRVMMDDVFGYDNFRNEIIWYYNSSPRKKGSFSNRHDTILRYSKSNKYTFNEDCVRVPYSKTAPRGYEKEQYYHPKGKVMGDVWKINILGQNDKTERVGYPTQKPKELINVIVLSSSNENDLVADFYGGSFTTAVVCKETNRSFLGCDLSENAVNIGKNRIRK